MSDTHRFSVLIGFALAGTLLSLSVASWAEKPSQAEKKVEQPKRALNDVHERLETLKKELNNSREAHKDAADALRASEKAISEANKKLFEIAQKQQKNSNSLRKLRQEAEATQKTLAAQQKRLSSQLYQQYMHGNASFAQMILQSEQPSLIVRDIHYFAYIAKARAQTIRNMQANLNKINQLNAETAAALNEMAELEQKQMIEKQTLEQQKLAKSKVVKSLSKQIASQRNEIKKLKRDEKRLAELVERLAQAALAKPRLSKKLTQKPASETVITEPTAQKTIASNNTLPSDEVTGINFSALKGKLRLPVRGDVTNRFGSNREDSGVSWKGLFIRADEGAEVKSVAGGRVVFADWLRGFGNLIIVDHGDGYMSLYGNNQSILKQAGQVVRAGDSIALVGNTGGNASHGVYYELRRQSKPFDPLSWSNLN
jgi:septal ring factor EnvC (AmiA/AmiB activator)